MSSNNFKAALSLSNLKKQNYIKHKIESFNSNIIYNLHMFDSTKNTLIGIYQLIINFDKIKNLNINDTLTQEETAKLIIDQKTKRKIFDKITNIGNIFLILSTEIKIINKKLLQSKNKQNINNIKKVINIENFDNNSEFKITPKTFKKKQIIRTMKNDRDIYRKKDNYNEHNEISLIECFKDENDTTTFSPGSTIKKYKSLNKQKITGQSNNNKYNDFYNNNSNISNISNNQYFNNSCTYIMSPKYRYKNYNSKEDENINIKACIKKSIIQNNIPTLNLMEQKLEPSLYNQREENTFELSTQSKEFKNTTGNFNKNTINNIKKNSFNCFNKNYKYNKNEINKIQNSTKTKNNIFLEESDFSQRKNYQNKKKILVNLSGKNNNEQIASEKKLSKINHKKVLSLNEFGQFNIDNRLNSNNINNIFLQTESSIRILSERKNCLKKNLDLRKKNNKKGNLIYGKFPNNYFTEKTRGTFSPKLSLKIKFSHGSASSNEKYERNNRRYNKKILTPKSNQIKIISFNKEDNIITENEQLKKRYYNLIDFYSLLKNKLQKTCKNDIKNIKKLEIMKEKINKIKKYKYRIIQIQNLNESKKIENHINTHYEEEKLINKMVNIKLKENSLYQNIFGEYSDKENIQKKINILYENKKEMLLNLIKNIVKFYGNISHIYNNNNTKKDLLKNWLNKYNIKEKTKINANYINYINKGNSFDDKIITEVDENNDVFKLAKRIAQRAVSGFLPDKTRGSTHYHTKNIRPKWSIGKIPAAEIGSHFFYNDIER